MSKRLQARLDHLVQGQFEEIDFYKRKIKESRFLIKQYQRSDAVSILKSWRPYDSEHCYVCGAFELQGEHKCGESK